MSNQSPDQSATFAIGGVEIRDGLDGLSPQRIATLYRRAPLRRPVDDLTRLWEMFEKSTFVITAWFENHLVGVARILSDGVIHSYLCDLAVEPDVQGKGVGRMLLETVRERCSGTELILRDTDASASFFTYHGFEKVDNAWELTRRARPR
jgi:GNAT superfamily N-acetyltransferase